MPLRCRRQRGSVGALDRRLPPRHQEDQQRPGIDATLGPVGARPQTKTVSGTVAVNGEGMIVPCASAFDASGKPGVSIRCTPGATSRLPAPATTSRLTLACLVPGIKAYAAETSDGAAFPCALGRGEMALT